MNNKGFAATSILYTVLVLFIIVMFGMITLLYGRNNLLNKIRSEVKGEINTVFNYDVYENGAVVYFNPETSTICSPANAVSTTGTKTGCMKWYVFNDISTNDFVYMILDHNTTATIAYADAQTELDKLVSESKWKFTPRLITANEVAMISGHPTFNSSTASGGSWFYFGSNDQSNTSLRSNYSWLYDYTYNCTSTGCNVSDNTTNGYWTLDLLSTNEEHAWFVSEAGYLQNYRLVTNAVANGVRPVIQVNKRLISSNPTNLVTNGDLALKNNTNFPSLTYNEDTDGGYLSYTTNSMAVLNSDELISIDPNVSYTLSMNLKSNNTTATHIIGFIPYDVDKNKIAPYHHMYISGSTTKLTQDLKVGDTIVYLENVSGFKTTSSSQTYQLGFIFWNYADSTGYTWPVHTYSRNTFLDMFEYNAIDITNNTITLKTPWTGTTISSGTELSQSNSGSVYNYSLVNYQSLNSEWTNYSSVISGINYSGSDNLYKFRPGTEYIQALLWLDYSKTPDVTVDVKNISLTKNS